MKRRVFGSLCLMALFALVLNTAVSLFFYYHFYERNAREDLLLSGRILADALATNKDEASFLMGLEHSGQKELRITLVADDGRVLYDNFADAAAMPNHGARPEIEAARRVGIGSDQRLSKTIGKVTYYSAVAIPGKSDILRLARDQRSVLGVFLQFLPLTILVAVLLFILSLGLSRILTRWLIRPIDRAADALAAGRLPDSYDELAPFFTTIANQQKEIAEGARTLARERDQINRILEHMEEGLVLLDNDHRVMAVNPGALRFFTPYVMPRLGEDMIALSRNPDLLRAVEEASAGHSSSGLLHHVDEVARFFVNPVFEDGAISGVIILLLDITAERAAQEAKEDFSANVSHELKTPLTAISGFAEMMAGGMVDNPAEMRTFAQDIYTEARRLLAMIDDILRLSHLEQGGRFRMEWVDLTTVVEDCIDRLGEPIADKALRLTLPEESVALEGNRSLLEELCQNLIDNAVKYNVHGGELRVQVEDQGEHVQLVVADTGIGIPEEDQPRIFERFYRVDKSHAKTSGGTGLGLSIVKHIVRRHSGELRLESQVGRGTVVTVRLPKVSNLNR